jgi:hypothetical protein
MIESAHAGKTLWIWWIRSLWLCSGCWCYFIHLRRALCAACLLVLVWFLKWWHHILLPSTMCHWSACLRYGTAAKVPIEPASSASCICYSKHGTHREHLWDSRSCRIACTVQMMFCCCWQEPNGPNIWPHAQHCCRAFFSGLTIMWTHSSFLMSAIHCHPFEMYKAHPPLLSVLHMRVWFHQIAFLSLQ